MRQVIGNPLIDTLVDGVLDRADVAVSVLANAWGGVNINLVGGATIRLSTSTYDTLFVGRLDRHGCQEYEIEFGSVVPVHVICAAIWAMT